ncbi:hypothetical protein FQV39_31730 (plasmid) [Bosea sp. F3-2]|uniref:hypothetical protein n=1 Tax=Bosea sp. F3-2 TaxID=2599640 RepID=UPI0011EE84C8|nr:hypothetical protein [Bosea sp. F3-2]QEL27159.1 hypothetical protein FQV39_31730 [Bosea sp. F3-2]
MDLLEEGALDGQALLTCLVLGYEIATRAGIALRASAALQLDAGARIGPNGSAFDFMRSAEPRQV